MDGGVLQTGYRTCIPGGTALGCWVSPHLAGHEACVCLRFGGHSLRACGVKAVCKVSLSAPAAAAGDVGTLTVLRRLGVPWGTGNVVESVVAWPGFARAALHWLMEHGARMGSHMELEKGRRPLRGYR